GPRQDVYLPGLLFAAQPIQRMKVAAISRQSIKNLTATNTGRCVHTRMTTYLGGFVKGAVSMTRRNLKYLLALVLFGLTASMGAQSAAKHQRRTGRSQRPEERSPRF